MTQKHEKKESNNDTYNVAMTTYLSFSYYLVSPGH